MMLKSPRSFWSLAGRCLLVWMVCSVPSLWAVTPNAAEILRAYRGNPQIRQIAHDSFQRFEAKLSTRCADVTERWEESTYLMVTPPVLDEHGRLMRAAWEERVPGVACARQRLYRVRVTISDGKGSVTPMLPGDGLSSPDLPEAVEAVTAAVRSLLPVRSACAVDVLDTRLRANGIVDSHAPWTEEWTVSACGRHMRVPVVFTPRAASGTDIDIELAGIREGDGALVALVPELPRPVQP